MAENYVDVLPLDTLLRVALESDLDENFLSKLNRLSRLELQETREQIKVLDSLISELSNCSACETLSPNSRNAVFDSYFRIRRIESDMPEVAVRSILTVYRSAILNASEGLHSLASEEWTRLISILPLLIEKLSPACKTDGVSS